ncbi:hypothetical protein Y695_04043 [Hydrogenophaga sp. T4]|nr:hypothetical protein Y695_04043 [Hydrogenophaga sp. T4]
MFLRNAGFAHARAAKDHDGVFYAQFSLCEIGFEHFQLEADAARFAAQQELGVGESQTVGVGLQRAPFVGVRLQLGPGVGQAAFVQVLGGFHAGLLRLFVSVIVSCSLDRSGAQRPRASASGTKTTASALPSMIMAATLSGSWW